MIDHTGAPVAKGLAKAAGNPPLSGRFLDEPGFRSAYYDEFIMLLGDAQASKWMERLDNLLASAFVDAEQDADILRKTAHAMVPLAGTPGFIDLARCCTELDHAISTGNFYFNELLAVRREARRAAIVLSRLRADLSMRVQSNLN